MTYRPNTVRSNNLAGVATSGQYADLQGKPSLGTAAALNTPIPMSSISQPVKSTIDAINALNDSAAYHNASEFSAPAALNTHAALTQAHGHYAGSLISAINIASTERQVTGISLPANALRVGTAFRIRGHAVFSMALVQSSFSTARVRVGPLSLSGTVAASVTVNNGKAKVSAPFMVEGELTVRSIGVVGTVGGWLAMWGAADAPFTDDITALSVFGMVNTTVPNVLELTYVTTNAAANSTFDVALIEGG